MEDSSLQLLAVRIEHETLACALRQVSHRSLSELIDYIDSGRGHARALACLRVGDLIRAFGGPCPIDLELLAYAGRADGPSFDRLVLRVLQQAYPDDVDASYLKARLGGPRWKLQQSLRRLVARELVARTGRTCDTRYAALTRDV